MGAPLSDRRYFGSQPVKQDCKLAGTGSDWPGAVVLLFSSFVSGSFFLHQLDSTPPQVLWYVLLPALVLVLALLHSPKTGCQKPANLQDVYRATLQAALQAAISCITS